MAMQSLALHSVPDSPPFDSLANSYDEVFTNTFVGRAQRQQVWAEVDRHFHGGDRILEINCGTGVDALHLAQRGVRVLACDSSPRMLRVARRRVQSAGLGRAVDLRILATEEISQFGCEGPFDGVLSNFAGLNCVEDLAAVGMDLHRLLKPGGKALICLFGPCCLWEIVWCLAQGNLNKAFRRFRGQGTFACLHASSRVRVHYPAVREMERLFAPCFRLQAWKGIGIAVPPSYLDFLAAGFPGSFRAAEKADRWLGRCPGIRRLADHVLLTFERARI